MLDDAMDAAGIDVLLVTSKHNVQYLLGGYRYTFFERMDAIGQSRYLPILIYPRGAPEKAAYFANRMESFEQELARFGPPRFTRSIGERSTPWRRPLPTRSESGSPQFGSGSRRHSCRPMPIWRCGTLFPCADPRGAWPAGIFESGKNSEGTRLLADCL